MQETQEIVKRLKECIEASKLTYLDLEKKTGLAKSSIQRYASGSTKKIPIDAIQLLAKALNITPEYILGWDFAPQADCQKAKIGSTIKELRILANMTRQEFAQKCNFESVELVKSIEEGDYALSNDELRIIAKILDVSVEKLTTSWKKEPAVLTFVYAMEDRIEKGYTIPVEANNLLLKYYNDRENNGCNLDILTDPEVSLLASYRELNEKGKARAMENIEDLTNLPRYQSLPTIPESDSEFGEADDVDTRIEQLFDPALLSDYRGTAGDPALVKAAHTRAGVTEEEKSEGLEKATMLVEAAKKKRKQGKNDE